MCKDSNVSEHSEADLKGNYDQIEASTLLGSYLVEMRRIQAPAHLCKTNPGDSESDSHLGTIVLRVSDVLVAENISYSIVLSALYYGTYTCKFN